MGRERTGKGGPAVHPLKGEELVMDPQKSVKLWKKGKRKQAHEELLRMIQTSPTPVRSKWQ
eukprot:scaffold67802_cov46-Prasinocladus_malaysianus.AAC.1